MSLLGDTLFDFQILLFISIITLALVVSHVAWPSYELQALAQEKEHFLFYSYTIITSEFFPLTSSSLQLSVRSSLLCHWRGWKADDINHMSTWRWNHQKKDQYVAPVSHEHSAWLRQQCASSLHQHLGKCCGVTSCLSSDNALAYVKSG